MKKALLTFTLFILALNLFAQNAHFTTSGTVEYNKTSNVYAMIEKEVSKDNEAFYRPFIDAYKKGNPQFKVLKSTLTFSGDKTLFVPIEPETIGNMFSNIPLANQNNTIYNDLDAKTTISEKVVFDATFLIKDTIRKIKWKITGETREVAGYTCRRANGIMMDSIYVVAFYTEKIHVSGGPESFNGLPGMILQVAVPHENIAWVATKVTDLPVIENAVQPPKKGKSVTHAQLITTLHDLTKNWGDNAQFYLKGFLF
ncbi:GLPGLI family protein [Mucilaginibacter sp.]